MRYDGFGRLINIKDPMGRMTKHSYDAFGRITDTINPVGDRVHDTYDLTGHVIRHEVIPVKGGHYLLATAGFNAAGQKLFSAGEDGVKTTYQYDINGQIADIYKSDRHHIALYYNVLNLPVKESLDDHPLLQVSYDHITAQPLIVIDNTGTTTYHYRNDELLQSIRHKGINSHPDTFSTFSYDNYHRVISRTDAGHNKIIYTFDRLARPLGITYQTNKGKTINVYNVVYGSFSRIEKKFYGDGMTRMLSYNAWGQVRTIKDVLNRQLLNASVFDYDANGNIINLQRNDNQGYQATTHYSYDRLNNLAAMVCQGNNTLCPHDTIFTDNHLKTAPVIVQQHYAFTPLNQIAGVTEKLVDAASSYGRSLSKTVTYTYADIHAPLRFTSISTQWNNQQPEIHTFIYDTMGNMTVDGEGNKISYDTFNHITQVVNPRGMISRYDYDGQGKEVKNITSQGTRWLIYQGRSLIKEVITDKDNTTHTIGYPAPEIKTTDDIITNWYESNYKGDVIGVLRQNKINGSMGDKTAPNLQPVWYGLV